MLKDAILFFVIATSVTVMSSGANAVGRASGAEGAGYAGAHSGVVFVRRTVVATSPRGTVVAHRSPRGRTVVAHRNRGRRSVVITR